MYSFLNICSSTVKPCFMNTPHYYGQFALSLGKKALLFSLNSTHLAQTPINACTLVDPLSVLINPLSPNGD